jgi:hypothetical protein
MHSRERKLGLGRCLAGAQVLALTLLCACEWPLMIVFDGPMADKDTVTACLPETELTLVRGSGESAGSAVAAGHFFGGTPPTSSGTLPPYSMGPDELLLDDLAVGDPRGHTVVFHDGKPDGELKEKQVIYDPATNRSGTFGAALAAANLDPAWNDRYELAIGTPGQMCGEDRASGAITLCTVSPEEQVCCSDTLCNPHSKYPAEGSAGDHFGLALTFGNFDADDRTELAVGAPDAEEDGLVWLFDVELIHPEGDSWSCGEVEWALSPILADPASLPEDLGTSPTQQRFGAALAAGHVWGEPQVTAGGVLIDQLVVGAPLGGTNDDGTVHVYANAVAPLNDRIDLLRSQFPVHEATPHGAGFGAALALGDLDDDGTRDVIIGSPDAEIDGIGGAGEVCYTRGDLSADLGVCVSAASVADMAASKELHFGAALAVGNFDGAALVDEALDLAVGAPGHDLPYGWSGIRDDAGATVVFFGGGTRGWNGLMATDASGYDTTVIAPDPPTVAGQAGYTLAAFNRIGDAFDDLAIGEPGYEAPNGKIRGRASVTDAVPNHTYLDYDDGTNFGVWSGSYDRPSGMDLWEVRSWEDPRRPDDATGAMVGGDVQLFFDGDPYEIPVFTHCRRQPDEMEPLSNCGEKENEPCYAALASGTILQLYKADAPATASFDYGAGCDLNGDHKGAQYTLCQEYWLSWTKGGDFAVVEECTPSDDTECFALQLLIHAGQLDPYGAVDTFSIMGYASDDLGNGWDYLCFGSPWMGLITFELEPGDDQHLVCEG